jgi:uncharacterized lipoprotein YajG
MNAEGEIRNAELKRSARLSILFILGSVVAAIVMGCAEKGPVLVSIAYQPTGAVAVAKKKPVVRVGPIRDSRGTEASLVGKKTVSGTSDGILIQRTVSELVTARLKDAFAARGFIVKGIMDADAVPSGSLNLLAGGEIKTLWLESSSSRFVTTLHTTVQLKIMLANADEKRIIKTFDINRTIDRYRFYSREKLEQELSQALSSALDQIFNDEAMRTLMK